MRIGCLGAARIAPAALVDPAKVRGGAVLQAVAARDVGRAEAFRQVHGFTRVAANYAELVTAPDVDLVYNALPIHLHAPWSIKALQAGKHVLCEKPFAMNLSQAREVLAAAETAGKRVIEAFHYRYHPGFNQMLAWIDAGAIGEVTAIAAKFTAPIPNTGGQEIRHVPDTGGGSFMDLGCYPLSWTLAVARRAPVAITASAQMNPLGVDESLAASLDFGGGLTAQLASSMAMDAGFAAILKVTGSAGEITYINPLAPQLGAQLSLKGKTGDETARVSRLTTYAYQLDAVLTALESGEPLPTEGEQILLQQETLDRIYEAAGLRYLRYWEGG